MAQVDKARLKSLFGQVESLFNWETESVKFQFPLDKEEPLLIYDGPSVDYSIVCQKKPSCTVAIEKLIAAKATSMYPTENGRKSGEPIADQLKVLVFSNNTVFVALADGCNWGDRPRAAAKAAVTGFTNEARKRARKCKTMRDLQLLLWKSLLKANMMIVEGAVDVWECGTCTLLGGLLVQVTTKESSQWIFCGVNVGDCSAFLVTENLSVIQPLTRIEDSREQDPGGRLGPYVDVLPDLRNLLFFRKVCQSNDLVTLCTDGVLDNFKPCQIGQPTTSKEDVSLILKNIKEAIDQAKDEPAEISACLIDHVTKITSNARVFMETTRNRLPDDRVAYPGKLDHATCIVIKVFDWKQACKVACKLLCMCRILTRSSHYRAINMMATEVKKHILLLWNKLNGYLLSDDQVVKVLQMAVEKSFFRTREQFLHSIGLVYDL